MKTWKTLLLLAYIIIFFWSGKPYEWLALPPADPFICALRPEPDPVQEPPRHKVPEEYRDMFTDAAASAGIPLWALESVAYIETGFNPGAMSAPREDGNCDLGMMQFNSKYLEWYARRYNGAEPFDPLDPGEAIPIAAKHLSFLYDHYGTWADACLAYNAGIGAVDRDEIPESSYQYLIKFYEGY